MLGGRHSQPVPERQVAESAGTSGRSTQAISKSVDQRDDFSDARVTSWAAHQVAGARRPASPQMTHRFEAFQEALPGLRTLQSTAVAQPIAHGHMAAFDGLGRLPARPMQACPKVLRAGTGRGYRLDIRLVVVGDDLIWDQPACAR